MVKPRPASPALAAWLPVALLGPPVLLRPIYRPGATVQPGASPASGAQRGRWDPRATLPIVLAGWGLLHAAAYILLRVSPYQWYYVPLAVSGALLAAAAEAYAARDSDPDGRIRATLEIIWLSGWAPHESQQKPLKPGSATTRLRDVLGKTQE